MVAADGPGRTWAGGWGVDMPEHGLQVCFPSSHYTRPGTGRRRCLVDACQLAYTQGSLSLSRITDHRLQTSVATIKELDRFHFHDYNMTNE